mgnify:CR=1 FL=1
MGDWIMGCEPALDDILGDPIVVALMCRDGVSAHHVRDVVHSARGRRATPRPLPAAVATSSF